MALAFVGHTWVCGSNKCVYDCADGFGVSGEPEGSPLSGSGEPATGVVTYHVTTTMVMRRAARELSKSVQIVNGYSNTVTSCTPDDESE